MNKQGIWTIADKKEEKFLKTKTTDFNFDKNSKEEVKDLVKKMREVMKVSDGIGLSANQIGINANVFVASIDNKFYAIFNSQITSVSEEEVFMEEGCLSVPEVFGNVMRPEKITLEGQNKNGKKIKIKAWGIIARVFQHEVDHLNGELFIDKATNLHKYLPALPAQAGQAGEIQPASDKTDSGRKGKNVI